MNKLLCLKIVLIASVVLNFSQSSLAQVNRPVKYSFEGNKVFSSEVLLDIYSKCLNRIQENNPKSFDELFDRNNEYCSKQVVRNFMFDKGFLTARIGDVRKEETENGLLVIIPVLEGSQYRLGEVKLDGESRFSEQNILKTFPVKKGEIIDNSSILGWITKLEEFYTNQGFIQFICEPEPTFAGNTVNLKLLIDEGNQFKIRSVNFLNNANLRNNYFRKYLTFDEGEVFSKQKLRETIEKLNNLNKFQYIDFEKDVDYLSDNESPVMDLKIHIKKKEK